MTNQTILDQQKELAIAQAELVFLHQKVKRLQWQDITTTPAPAGIELLLYLKGGTMIQGNSKVIGYTHWMRKPASPGKQKWRYEMKTNYSRSRIDEIGQNGNTGEHYEEVIKHNHYFKNVTHLQYVDVYRVLDLFNVSDPCMQHAIKKLLVAGERGAGKDIDKDIQEAIDSLERWKRMLKEDAITNPSGRFAE
jgi:hypothetical protein